MKNRIRFSYWAPIFWELDIPEFRDRSAFLSNIDGLTFDENTIATHQVPYEVGISLVKAPRYMAGAVYGSNREQLDYIGRRFEYALKFNFSSIYPGDQVSSQNFEVSNSQHTPYEWWEYWVDDQAQSVLQKFTISSQLSWPYARPPMHYFRFTKQQQFRYKKFPFSPLSEAFPHGEEAGYDVLENLDTMAFAKFLFGEGADQHSARLKKFISYLSYLFTWENIRARKSQIIWACAALEAFYATGASGRSDELRRHLPLFLNTDTKGTARDISKIYARRSKFLHGNERIQSLFDYEDTGPEDETEFRDTSVAVYFAIETLRKVVRDNLHDVEFVREIRSRKY